MAWRYKTVGAPEEVVLRRRGAAGAQALAEAVDEILSAEAAAGWEYCGASVMPLMERPGLLGPPRQVERAVLVFRRPAEEAPG